MCDTSRLDRHRTLERMDPSLKDLLEDNGKNSDKIPRARTPPLPCAPESLLQPKAWLHIRSSNDLLCSNVLQPHAKSPSYPRQICKRWTTNPRRRSRGPSLQLPARTEKESFVSTACLTPK